MRHAIGRRLVVIFLIGSVLLNYPVLALFSRDEMIAGIPLLYVYVFVTWGVLIAAMAMIVRQRA
jgi:hypothetical protein